MTVPTYRIPAVGGSANAINIELWGFRQCRLATPEVVAAALACLPPHHLEGLKSVRYEHSAWVPGISRWLRLPGLSKLKGRFDRQSSSILLHACANRDELFHTLFHEAGHFVYFRVITSFEKKQWVTSVFRSEPPVSQYGARNAAEDFAEAFSTFVLHRSTLSRHPRKERFLAEVVFRGMAVDHGNLASLMQEGAENPNAAPRLDCHV